MIAYLLRIVPTRSIMHFFQTTRATFAITGLFLIASHAAYSQDGTVELVLEPIKYEDWAIECSSANQDEQCIASQSILVKGSVSPLLIARVLKNDENSLTAILSLPKNTFLLPGIQMQIDSKPALKIGFETCNDTGCHAGFLLNGSVFSNMKRGSTAFVTFQSQTGETIKLPMSLIGFTAATNHLMRN